MEVHAAFHGNPPTCVQVIDHLAAQGDKEIVFVPLELNSAIQIPAALDNVLRRSRSQYPDLRCTAARPVGPEVSLLNVLDTRLRAALSHARCLELDGLVLSSPASGDVRGSSLLARRARQWATHHRLPCVTAVTDESGPSVAQAILNLRSQGRRHIAVGSFFLAPDEDYLAQAEQAYHYGAVSVSEPIGAAREVVDVILARYAFAAMELLDFDFGEPDAAADADEMIAVTA
jgi:sirohydrochlorin ferrochelatase